MLLEEDQCIDLSLLEDTVAIETLELLFYEDIAETLRIVILSCFGRAFQEEPHKLSI